MSDHFFWYLDKKGNSSTSTQPYSWIKWNKRFVDDGNLSWYDYLTIAFILSFNVEL